MAANGNTGNSTGQSAASAQAAAAAGNAAASNAANSGNTSTSNSSTSTNTSSGESSGKGNAGSTNTNTSNGATNSAGLMGSLIGFGNAVAKGEVGNNGGSGSGGADNNTDTPSEGLFMSLVQQFINAENARKGLPSEVADKGDKAYTKARAEGKTEAEAQKYARKAVTTTLKNGGYYDSVNLLNGFAFRGKNIGPTYNPATTAMANTNPAIAAGSSEMGPSTPAANNAPANIGGETGGIAGSTETGGSETAAPSANNTGVTYRGGTVSTPSGTSVTDSGTGGSISSMPSRDASSIGLGVYDTDRANYDQDNWNRGMEAESSSLVSDEECKAFAKRAFMENSEPFKVVRTSIIKKC